MTDPHPTECHVCGETVEDPKLLAECLNCGRPFHLNPYSGEEHKDCGDALIGPTMGIEFWCNPCLTELEAAEAAADGARQMMELIAGPGQQLPVPAPPAPERPPAAPPSPDAPPPRRRRATERRRYRRIDGQ